MSRAKIKFSVQRGVSLIEVMVSITLGMIILLAVVIMFANSTRSEKELKLAAQQIENGRYALDTLSSDLHLAGYYGVMSTLTVPTTLSDPCMVVASSLTNVAAGPRAFLGQAVQGYAAPSVTEIPDMSATSCGTLDASVLMPGSDVIVTRRADTVPLMQGVDTAIAKEVYIQSSATDAQIQLGAGAAITSTSKADGTTAAILKKKDGTAAEIRKFHIHIYYVDKSGATPALKRLELTQSAGATVMQTYTVAEGIEMMTVLYGIDDTPTTINDVTGLIGDGVADQQKREPTDAEFAGVVSVNVKLLARNSEATTGFADTKQYDLGHAGLYVPSETKFKRHLFSSTVRLVNPASRREIP